MTDDAVSRAEHMAAIARLDAADSELRAAIATTERALRQDYEGKIAGAVTLLTADLQAARADLKEDVLAARTDLKSDIDGVDDHLTWQDRAVGGGVITFIVLLVLQFTNHIFG